MAAYIGVILLPVLLKVVFKILECIDKRLGLSLFVIAAKAFAADSLTAVRIYECRFHIKTEIANLTHVAMPSFWFSYL